MPALCVDDRDRCLREGAAELARVLPTLSSELNDAYATLRRSPHPAARAWAAYAALRLGDANAAETLLHELDAAGYTSMLTPDATPDRTLRALYLARELTEAVDDEGSAEVVAALPCAVFAWEGVAARRAFGPAYGSTRDRRMAPFPERCAAEALGGAMTPAASQRVLAAIDAMSRALFREFPRPDDGTMWVAAEIDAREALTGALLGFSGDARASDARMRDVVARLASGDPRSLSKVGNFRRAAEGHVTALANGICAAARARGEAVTGGQCQRRAYSAEIDAFTSWVSATRGQQ